MTRAVSDRLAVIPAALSGDPREAPRVARQLGFRGLLFDVWSSLLDLTELSLTGRREFKRIVSTQDQEIVGLRMDLGPKGISIGADVDRQIARINRALECAAGLQSPLLCVDIGPLPRAAIAPKPKPAVTPQQAGLIIIPQLNQPEPEPQTAPPTPPDPAYVSQVQSALVEIGQSADRYGVMIAFSASLAGFASLSQALAAARCQWFGIDLDPVTILRDELSKDEIFSMVGPLIRHVRARDALAGDDKRTRPAMIGQGSTNWAELLSMLDEAGYNGFITIDPLELSDRTAAAVGGLNHLKSVIGQ